MLTPAYVNCPQTVARASFAAQRHTGHNYYAYQRASDAANKPRGNAPWEVYEVAEVGPKLDSRHRVLDPVYRVALLWDSAGGPFEPPEKSTHVAKLERNLGNKRKRTSVASKYRKWVVELGLAGSCVGLEACTG